MQRESYKVISRSGWPIDSPVWDSFDCESRWEDVLWMQVASFPWAGPRTTEEDKKDTKDQARTHLFYLLLTADMMWPAVWGPFLASPDWWIVIETFLSMVVGVFDLFSSLLFQSEVRESPRGWHEQMETMYFSMVHWYNVSQGVSIHCLRQASKGDCLACLDSHLVYVGGSCSYTLGSPVPLQHILCI